MFDRSGGLATAILTSPLDVLRTRLYLPSRRAHALHSPTEPAVARLLGASLRHVRETTQIIGSIHRTEGWGAFFRGLGPSLSGVVPATAIKFYVYGNCKRLGARSLGCQEDAALVHAQAAVAAGLATATATNPIWLVKTRLQLDASRAQAAGSAARRYKNSLDCVRQVLRQEGVRGLYRGLSASYLGTAETALHLVLYEQLKLLSRRALGGTSTQDATTWGEVLRTRLRQAPMENGAPKYAGLVHCARLIRAEEGWSAFYGGLTPHLLRSIPSAIITLGVYEFVLRWAGA
ncbi:mitochondrial carrier domain-containing protein [Parachaetomium inaequale]|uniref:Mitochondrial carrier domain-containing protein n=1 Tax=Parachaetomium inaequale TaxID=2588326 RepID=A0AAN6PMW7_9PEZI|nr:mitochondrial carrier domain-containing protein [Parachaetomium inaequale]